MQLGEINLKVKIGYSFWEGFYAIDDNYEPGFPYGSGQTIQEAIDEYLDRAHDFYIERWNHTKLTYTWL